MATSLQLFGTTTSPFVRRVRVVCLEKGVACTLVDASTPDGQAELRRRSPVWKVPAALFADGRVVWDSRVILDEIDALDGGSAPLRPIADDPRQRTDEQNLIQATDEALLALVRLFYLGKEGLDLASAPYLVKERERALNLLAFLNDRVRGAWCTPVEGFGRAELALTTALAWMRFRGVADVDAFPHLVAFERAHADRSSLRATLPG